MNRVTTRNKKTSIEKEIARVERKIAELESHIHRANLVLAQDPTDEYWTEIKIDSEKKLAKLLAD